MKDLYPSLKDNRRILTAVIALGAIVFGGATARGQSREDLQKVFSLEPLVASRSRVESVFPDGWKSRIIPQRNPDGPIVVGYATEIGRFFVTFSVGRCNVKSPSFAYDVEAGIITDFVFYPVVPFDPKLILYKRKNFVRESVVDVPGAFSLYSDSLGVGYSEIDKKVKRFQRYPNSRQESSSCENVNKGK